MSHVGLVREHNEDSMVALDATAKTLFDAETEVETESHSVVVAVADGMGGPPGGDIASRLAVEHLASAVLRSTVIDAVPDVVLRMAFELAHDSIRNAARDLDYAGMGTTLSAVHVGRSHATIAHVGDTRVYLLRDDVVHLLTEDQTVVHALITDGLIDASAARFHPGRGMLTQAMGGQRHIDPYTARLELLDDDRLLVCSDGLWEGASEEVLLTCGRAPSLLEGARRLVRSANARGGRDNISAVMVHVRDLHSRKTMGSQRVPNLVVTNRFKPPGPST